MEAPDLPRDPLELVEDLLGSAPDDFSRELLATSSERGSGRSAFVGRSGRWVVGVVAVRRDCRVQV